MNKILAFILFFNFTASVLSQTIVKMEKKDGVYYVPCKVNSLPLKFIFDTGASNVSISLIEAIFMYKNDYLKKDDFIETEYYKLANGEIEEGTKVIIRKLEIGDMIIPNVEATIIHNALSPLLLGQSLLQKFGKVNIDYESSTISFSNKKERTVDVIYITDAMKYYNSGNEKRKNLDYNGAIKDYDYSLHLDANFAPCYINRALSKAALEKYKEALCDLNKAIELDSTYYEAYSNKGLNEYILKDYKAALKDLSKAIQLNPNSENAYCTRGLVYCNLSEEKKAIKDLDFFITKNTQTLVAFSNRGLAKAILKDYKGAIADFTSAIELDPIDAVNYYKRGNSKKMNKDYKGAMLDFNKALELDNKYAKVYFLRGITKLTLGIKKDEACSDFYKAKELNYLDADEAIKAYCN